MWSRDQSLETLAFLWEKLSWPQFYKDLTRKIAFFELVLSWSWFKFNNLGLALGTNLKVYTSLSKGLKLKVRKFWGLILAFAEVTGEKLVGRPFYPPPSWIGLTSNAWAITFYNAFYHIMFGMCLWHFSRLDIHWNKLLFIYHHLFLWVQKI